MAKKKAAKARTSRKPERKPFQGFGETLLYGLVLAGLPTFFAWLLQLTASAGQRWLFSLLMVSLGVAWWLRRTEIRELRCQDPCLSGLFLHGCLLMVLLIVWNTLFRVAVSNDVDFTADIFQARFRNFYAPFCGTMQAPQLKGFFFTLMSGGVLGAYLLKTRNRAFEESSMLIPAAFLLLLSMSMALSDNVSRLTDWMAHYGQFAQGVPLFASIPELLANYTAGMDPLEVLRNHYPPGILLLLKTEDLLGFKGLARAVVMLSGLGTLWVLRQTGRMVGGTEGSSRLAVFFFVLSPGILVYITVDPGFIVVFPASLALYFFLQSMLTGKPAYALGMGLMFSLYTFFAFSSGFLTLLLGILFLLLWRGGLMRLADGLTQITLSIACFTAVYIALYYVTGFNLLACLKEAVHNITAQLSNGFDNGYRYLLRSTGAILVYLAVAGIPQSYLISRPVVRAIKEGSLNSLSPILAVGVGLSLLVCGFSGFFFLETERIWLFFTPALAVAAGCEADRIFRQRGFAPVAAMLICSMLLSAVYELYLQAFNWR